MTATEEPAAPGTAGEIDLSDSARAVLEQRGIDPAYAVETCGVREVLTDADLPPEFAGNPWATTPALVFEWTEPVTGRRVPQLRPHSPRARDDGSTVKYVFPEDDFVNLGLIRPAAGTSRVSLIVEGTMQSLAAARHAPDDVTVYAMPGCWGWSEQQAPTGALAGLTGTDVVISLDADAERNRDVYDAGARLADALGSIAGAEPRFTRLGAGGSTGLDDLLSGIAPEHRRTTLDNLIGAARRKPADRTPEKKRRRSGAMGQATFAGGLVDPNDTALATTWADPEPEGNGATARWRVLLETTKWLRYHLGRWEAVSHLAPYNDLARYCHEIAQAYLARAGDPGTDGDDVEKLEEAARALMSHNKLTTILARAAGHSDLHVSRDDLDGHPTLWPAGNGVLDLLSWGWRDHDPELLLTAGSDVLYDPEATCPRFDAFLDEVLPDPEVRAYVLRLFGAAMFGEVRANAQVFTVFVGTGRNGKGALVRTVERVFGRMAVTVDPRTLQEAKFEGHSQEVAKLAGKRLATAQEPEKGKGWNTGRIKSWTGGDRLTGRFMGQNDFEFAPSHTLVVTANERPPVARSDSAFWMRYREVPFDVSIEGREDPGLEAHIAAHELPGVLNRVLAGLADYLRQGLAEPAAVRLATHDAQVESDHLAVFVETHLVVTGDDDDRLLATDVFEACRKWWAQNVRHEAMPSDRGRSNFTTQIQRVLGIEAPERNPRKAKVAGSVRLYWHGLRWLEGPGEGHEGGSLSGLGGLPTHGNPGTTELGNPAPGDSPVSEPITPDPTPGLPMSGTEVAENKTDTATDDTLSDQGLSSEVAEVAEVADIARVHTHTGREKEASESESREEFSRTGTAMVAIGNLATRATLPPVTIGPVVFDIETGDAGMARSAADPEGFVRIAAVAAGGQTTVTTGPAEVVEHVVATRKAIGHNVIGYDLPVLARVDPRVDLLAMTRQGRVHDTMIVESVLHPVLNDGRAGAVGRAQKWFALDAVAERYGVPGKSDDLKALAKRHGGFDAIPVDDEDYRSYCAGDVEATYQIAGRQAAELARCPETTRAYVAREHRVHAIASTMGAIGLTVDQKATQHSFWQGYRQKSDLTRALVERYGIPTVKADGKPADSPAATKAGKTAVLTAFASLGADLGLLEKTKGGQPAFGSEPMARFAQLHEGYPRGEEIGALCGLMGDVAGVRTVYGTALEHLHADGRVHPEVATLQASGRWSVRNPGLTVFGKRSGRVVERGIFTASSTSRVLFAIDLSQIDARAIAVHSQDPAYMALFEPGLDAHEIVGRMVWGDAAYDAEPKRLRNLVKAITHGLPYGMGVPKLATSANVDETVAQRVVDTMNERFPRLQEWKEEVREQAATGAPLDNGFGRRMLPDPERAYTQGVALIGQGTARDLMMECLLRLPDELARCLRAQVHDEAVFEGDRDTIGELKAAVERAFNYTWKPPHVERPIRIEAEAGPHGYRWSDCY